MALTKVTNSMLDLAVAPDATTTALGVDALASNTTGQYGVAVGVEAFQTLTPAMNIWKHRGMWR